MKVLVTGGCGFIGSNLVTGCLREGWDVTVVDDLSNGHLEFLPASSNPCEIADFASERTLHTIRTGAFDCVFHLAAVPRVGYSVEHPLETNDINVVRTLRLLEACKGNVGRVVFASSSSVYGNTELLPTAENDPKRPRSPYALQKLIIEEYLALYADLYGLLSTSLRFFNVFGPNCLGSSPYATALASWLTAIKRGEPLRFDGDGEQSRDLCYVDNVVHACVLAAQAPKRLGHRAYNVACGERTTNKQLFERLLERYANVHVRYAPERPGDVKHTLADVSRIREELGYVPLVGAEVGIQRTCEWYDANWTWLKELTQAV